MRSIILRLILVLAFTSVLAQVALAASASDPAAYPLSTCIVSGRSLGGETESVTAQYEGRELRFCSKKCLSAFEKNPSSYVAKLDQAIIEDQLRSYPLEICVVSGEKLGGEMGEPANYLYGNRLVRVCCVSCTKGFEKDPASYLAKLDQAAIAAQLKSYPAESCPVSGQKLGSMGGPYDYIFGGRLVRLCCKGCLDKFNESPSTALAAIYGEDPVKRGEQHDHQQSQSSEHDH